MPTLAENKPDVTIKFSCDASIAPIPASVASISSGPLTYKTEWDEENGRINRNEFQYGNATYGLGASRDLPGLAQLSGSSGQPNKELRDDLEAIIQVGARSLQDIRHVPPVRGFLRSRYELGSQPAAEFTSSVNPDENASQLSTTLAYESSLRSQVSELMADITGVRLSHSLRPGQLTAVVSNRSVDGSEKEIVPTNQGFGTNQLVHLITQVLLTPVGGTVLIEEPEIHLHPGAQVKLASWLAEHAVRSEKQLLITTHGEHFLAGLLWQVRNDVVEPSDIGVYYFALDSTGATTPRRYDVTHGGISQGSFGEFFRGPEGYIGWQDFFRGL